MGGGCRKDVLVEVLHLLVLPDLHVRRQPVEQLVDQVVAFEPLQVGLDLRLPEGWIAEETLRLAVYRRIAAARDDEELARSFGLSDEASREAVGKMLKGAVDTMFSSSLDSSEVMDLVPVKPLGEDEEAIRNIYTTRLSTLYSKLKS